MGSNTSITPVDLIRSTCNNSPDPFSTSVAYPSLNGATVRNLHSGRWTSAGRPLGLDLSDNIHALNHFPEDDVLVVEPRRGGRRNKELGHMRAAISVSLRTKEGKRRFDLLVTR